MRSPQSKSLAQTRRLKWNAILADTSKKLRFLTLSWVPFSLDLLAPPKGFDEYLREAQFLLCVGENAPFKSPAEVEALPLTELEFWVKKMVDFYEEQQRRLNDK